MKTSAKLFLVEGRVQGVGFRYFAEAEANKLGLRGYVRNLHDGRVEVYVMGEAALLEKFRKRLEEGPPASRVERVEVRAAPHQDYSDFVIEAGGESLA